MDLRPTASVPAASAATPERARLERAAVQFESLFIHQMLKQMRSSAREVAGEGGLFQNKGQDMLDHADTLLADNLAGQRAFGIADAILRQLLPAGTPLKQVPAPVALQGNALPPAAAPNARKKTAP